jgi:8-oxo-dGTP pyrophosphatase MutT (NUDIX family)
MDTSHFSAGFILKKFGDDWYALVVQDKRFRDLKAAGGMWIEGESPLDTLRRELRQELGVELVGAELVYEVSTNGHTKHFFLATEVNGLPAIDEKRELKEIRAGKPGDILEMRWMKMLEFADRIYSGQIPAFAKAITQMACISREFCNDNTMLLMMFSPEE